MTTNTPSVEEQRRAVYAGICAVASNCDGARQADGVGFNGQDTLFGKRIAAEPFERWTEDVHVEAARIALTYKVQILSYIGVDMAQLDIVREAAGLPTNRQARDDARSFERTRRQASQRFVHYRRDRVEFEFPFNDDIRVAIKKAGDATFDGQVWPKVWWVPADKLNAAHVEVAQQYGFQVDDEADRWMEKALTRIPEDPAKRVHGIMISNEIVFLFNGVSNWAEVKGAVKAAGARFEPSDKSWRVALANPAAAAVVAAARSVGLVMAGEVDGALRGAGAALTATLTKAEMLLRASATSRPAELPAEFEAMVRKAMVA
jgi:hypothetical protein